MENRPDEVRSFRYLPSDCFNGEAFPVVSKCLFEVVPGILLFILVVEPLRKIVIRDQVLSDFEPRREDPDFSGSCFRLREVRGGENVGNHSVDDAFYAFKPRVVAGDRSGCGIIPVKQVGGKELVLHTVWFKKPFFC